MPETSARPRTERLPVTAEAIETAATALGAPLPPTPLQYSRAFAAKSGCHVYLKIEDIQPTRSFKVRGALNKLIRMPAERRAAGLITVPAGGGGLVSGISLYLKARRPGVRVIGVEPGGAAALAALLYHHTPRASERVAVILSGANVTDDAMVRALRAR